MQTETNSLDLCMKMFREIEDADAEKVIASIIEEERAHHACLGRMLETK